MIVFVSKFVLLTIAADRDAIYDTSAKRLPRAVYFINCAFIHLNFEVKYLLMDSFYLLEIQFPTKSMYVRYHSIWYKIP